MGGPKGGGIAGSTSATPTSGVYSGTAIQGIQSWTQELLNNLLTLLV